MSFVDKLDAAKNYLLSHYGYKNGSGAAVYVYNDATLDCHSATEIMGDFAKDINAQVKYVSTYTGKMHDYLSYAKSDGGHTFNRILINGNWVNYDACPLP